MGDYEAVIGLEVHVQLRTRSKIFCRCSTVFGAPPNTQTCPVCLGYPGALPVLNGRAVELAALSALALGAQIAPESVLARKNYFYPDLPKGYQISQYDRPLAVGGAVSIEVGDGTREIRLIRLHLEEDAGKSLHEGLEDAEQRTCVDLNRAGVPLAEIVSEPDLRTPEEAYFYLQRLRSILRYVGSCDGNMEQGSLRCDANVSVRPRGQRELGTRTELKNLNSFRNVQRALEYEIRRQIEVLDSGGRVRQETVLWDANAGVARSMRGKEEAEDYRYFPEPDLPPVVVDPARIDALRAELPELPAERKRRIRHEHGVGAHEAHLLTLEAGLADYFEEVARLSGNPRATANYLLNDLLREQNEAGLGESEIPLAADALAELIRLVDAGTISSTAARQEIFPRLYREGGSAAELMREQGLEQVSDAAELESAVRRVVDEHPGQVEQYRAGKTGLLGFLVGKVMRISGGRANPRVVNELLRKVLD